MPPGLVEIGIALAPEIIKLLREAFAKQNPDVPQPTETEIVQAATAGLIASLGVDDRWLAQHPDGGTF
jgi:hypothetical protein